MEHSLLVVGLIFPAISWLTLVGGIVQARRTGKSSSGIYIPFIGPILIDLWIIAVGAPKWMLVVPWMADIGTLLFLRALPRLILDAWRTSRFTRTFLLTGGRGNQAVEISFHKGGYYVLRKTWQRAAGECGMTARGEPGTFVSAPDGITLTSHTGSARQLRQIGNGFVVEDSGSLGDYSLDQWMLQKRNA